MTNVKGSKSEERQSTTLEIIQLCLSRWSKKFKVSDDPQDPRLISEPWKFTADQRLVCPRMTIGELPDDVLLEIFSSYLGHQRGNEDAWHALVHVCRRWRCLVFASPRHLHLRLLLSHEGPVGNPGPLDVWPELPITIRADLCATWRPRMQALMANVITALEQHDRVYEIVLGGYPNSLLTIFHAMEKPFLSLVNLKIGSIVIDGLMIPDSFLVGSAPRLQSLEFIGILCPEIEKLLLSTPNLVFLRLDFIHRSGRGYTSPEAMVKGLSVLTRLKSLRLLFLMTTPPSQSLQASGHPFPFARVILPALTDIDFFGDKEYLEDFVSRIDTPLLTNITISFIDQSVSVTPPLCDFISRTETFGAYSKMDTYPSGYHATIEFFRRDGEGD